MSRSSIVTHAALRSSRAAHWRAASSCRNPRAPRRDDRGRVVCAAGSPAPPARRFPPAPAALAPSSRSRRTAAAPGWSAQPGRPPPPDPTARARRSLSAGRQLCARSGGCWPYGGHMPSRGFRIPADQDASCAPLLLVWSGSAATLTSVDPEVADAPQQSVQRRLIPHRAGDDRRARDRDHLHAVEGSRYGRAQLPLDDHVIVALPHGRTISGQARNRRDCTDNHLGDRESPLCDGVATLPVTRPVRRCGRAQEASGVARRSTHHLVGRPLIPQHERAHDGAVYRWPPNGPLRACPDTLSRPDGPAEGEFPDRADARR